MLGYLTSGRGARFPHGDRFPHDDRLQRVERVRHRRVRGRAALGEVPLPQRGNLPRRRQARERGHAVLGGEVSRELVVERHLLRDRRHRGSRRDRRCCGRVRDAREATGLGEALLLKRIS